jgi:hypothetical protein
MLHVQSIENYSFSMFSFLHVYKVALTNADGNALLSGRLNTPAPCQSAQANAKTLEKFWELGALMPRFFSREQEKHKYDWL